MKVSIFVPVYEPLVRLPTTVSARQMHKVDEFSRAMGSALAIEVPIIEGSFAEVATEGYVLAFGVPETVDPALNPRIVAFDEDRSSIMRRLEEFGFAAAVEKHRYFQWRTKRDAERGYGLVGQKTIAALMSARLASGPYTSEHYSIIASDTARDLPELLAEYLRAHAAAG